MCQRSPRPYVAPCKSQVADFRAGELHELATHGILPASVAVLRRFRCGPEGEANELVTMRVAIILIAALWGIAAVVALVRTRERPWDAKLTAAYILGYPVLVIALLLGQPVPMWIGVPAVFGFIPWLMAGPHLWRILRDPAQIKADEVIGIPRAYWFWGGLSAFALGIVFG